MDVVSWLLSKKYTDNSLIGIGALKGAPCKVKSVIKRDGQNIVTLTWKDDLGVDHDTQLEINDGTPIYTWGPNYHYEYGDLVIYQASFYRCKVANSDATFVASHWDPIGSGGGGTSDYEDLTNLPEVNGVQLIGDKSLEDLGIESLTNVQMDTLLSVII